MIILYVGSENTDFAPLQRHAKIVESAIRRPTLGESPINQRSKELRIPACLQDPREEFASMAKLVSAWLEEDDVTVIVSTVLPMKLNPLLGVGPENFLAMLILAFPEVRWLFGTIGGYNQPGVNAGELDAFRKAHGLQELFRPDQASLFDGAGLRDWVRQRASEHTETTRDARYLSRRTQCALALDEETPYANLHAYAAYRFGYRAVAADSFALADHLLRMDEPGNPSCKAIRKWNLILEDIYVNFADGKQGASKLYEDYGAKPGEFKGRAKEWPRLEAAEHRIFVTSGHHDDPIKWQLNSAYLEQQQAGGKHIHTLYKPYAGIFRLWESAGLMRKLRWSQDGITHVGVAEGFLWPPRKESFSISQHSHSSPGVLLLIAESLIERAEKLLPDDVKSVQDAVRGAVLVNDALELLGGRTPTVAVEALTLKHRFEVLAECQFSGVEHNIRLKERITEIRRDVRFISQWFGRRQQEVAALNAEMQTLMALVRVFREFAQFDEEQVCMQHARTLHRKIWFQQNRSWLATAIYPFRWYVDYLLGSVPRFVGAIGIWILILTLLFAAAGAPNWKEALEATFSSFIGIQPPSPNPNLAVTMLAMLSGATHLGIFISHLYSIVSRK